MEPRAHLGRLERRCRGRGRGAPAADRARLRRRGLDPHPGRRSATCTASSRRVPCCRTSTPPPTRSRCRRPAASRTPSPTARRCSTCCAVDRAAVRARRGEPAPAGQRARAGRAAHPPGRRVAARDGRPADPRARSSARRACSSRSGHHVEPGRAARGRRGARVHPADGAHRRERADPEPPPAAAGDGVDASHRQAVRVGDAAHVARELEAPRAGVVRRRRSGLDADRRGDRAARRRLPPPRPRGGVRRGEHAGRVHRARSTSRASRRRRCPPGCPPDGLPIGVQLVGPKDGDLRVLQVSHQLEEAMPWRGRVPPLVATAS